MNAAPTHKKRRRRLVLAVVIVVVLATAGYTVNYAYEQAKCGPLGCETIDSPMIQQAQVVTSQGKGYCQFAQGYPTSDTSWETVCSVYVNGGNTGTISLTVTNQGSAVSRGLSGGSLVDFWVYSSLPNYINFTGAPTCAYTSSTPPLNGAATCNIPYSSTQTFQFTFTVSQSYGSSADRELASVTIVMDQTCCFL